MGADAATPKIDWYRSPLSREQLARFNRRSDLKGLLQTGGYLGLLAFTGTAAFLAAGRLPWPAVVVLLLFHGTCCSFLINAFHELVHGSVFRTPLLNRVFLAIVCFLGWHNPVGFWASHRVHHKSTLYPAVDPEGQPSASPRPDRDVVIDLLRGGIVAPLKLYGTVKTRHMYVAVPCYHLGALHRAIRHDLPWCPRGLFQTWLHIAGILRRQARDPGCRHVPELPAPR